MSGMLQILLKHNKGAIFENNGLSNINYDVPTW